MTRQVKSLIDAIKKPKYTFFQAKDFAGFVKKFIADNKINPLIVFDTKPLISMWKKERGIE